MEMPATGVVAPVPWHTRRQQEESARVIDGCTLPPKVQAAVRGAVLVSVPHVVQSSAADAIAERQDDGHARLPKTALVRVRWWGEDAPGSSLFRPTLLNEHARAGNRRSPNGPIQMRYAVCVTPSQLLEYFNDMKELVFDVIDRDTRKKVGRSVLPLSVEHTDDSAEIVLQKLCQTNMVCEIHATDSDAPLGYLTVNFKIQWDESPAVSTPLKWANNGGVAPVISINRTLLEPKVDDLTQDAQPERKIQQRLSFSSISSESSSMLSHQEGGRTHVPPWRHDRLQDTRGDFPTLHDQSRLDHLLEKGRELQLSMSKAMTQDTTRALAPDSDPTLEISSSPINTALALVPYEAMTEELDDNSWERVLDQSEPIVASTNDHNPSAQIDADVVSLGEYNALELSFESMELEPGAMERLRQLREGSISTRFSPVQIVVSHEQPVCLFSEEASARDKKWIAAFAVNSSLRKRNWRPKYTHSLPLFDAVTPVRPSLRQTTLRLRVRCQPQQASPPGCRQRSSPSRINLLGDIPVTDLLNHIHRERVVSIPLREGDEDSENKTKMSQRDKKKLRTPIGNLTIKLRLCVLDREVPRDGDKSALWQSAQTVFDPLARHREDCSQTDLERGPRIFSSPQPRPTPPEMGTSPMFFALIVGQAKVKSTLTPDESIKSSRRMTLRLEYGTPTVFCRSADISRLKRSAKAILRTSRNDTLRADLNHMNVFPVELDPSLTDKLRSSVLILEAWVLEQSTTLPSYSEEKFLGVIKVPLNSFKGDVRDKSKITKVSKHCIPLVRIDQDFPIIDPFDDTVNGQIRVCVAFGSAEQLFNLKSTISAVVKLQSRVRGWRTRRAFTYWKQFELTTEPSEDEGICLLVKSVLSERSNSHATNGNLTGFEGFAAPDRSSHYHTQLEHFTQVTVEVIIRERFLGGVAGHSVLGCEVLGQLRLHDELTRPTANPESDGPKFTLWWDSQNQALNSTFKHCLYASDVLSGISLQDASFVFRIQLHEKDLSKHALSLNDTVGVAVMDLVDAIDDIQAGGMTLPETFDVEKDVEVPILWDGNVGSTTKNLPLRLRLQLTPQLAPWSIPVTRQHHLPVTLPDDKGKEYRTERVALVRRVSRTERLLPAAMWLCLDVQRISDMKDLLTERLYVARESDEEPAITEALNRTFIQDEAIVTISMSFCVGVDLTSVENKNVHSANFRQDDKGRWHKTFSFKQIHLKTSNGVQALPSTTQGYAHVLVHPELIESLQEESLHIQLLLEEANTQVVLGDVQVPLAALLFRPSGIQGSFPVRVENDVQGGRVGVHLYIDEDGDLNSSRANYTRLSNSIVHQQSSRLTRPLPTKVQFESNPTSDTLSEEQTLEQAVASIHEAAKHIQDRLSRLTSLVPDPEVTSNNPTNPRSSPTISPDQPVSSSVSTNGGTLEEDTDGLERDGCFDLSIHDQTSTVLNAPDMTKDHDSNTADRVKAQDLNDVRSDISKREWGPSEASSPSEKVEDESFLKPLSLESFGIVEMEMSPISPTPSEETLQSNSQAELDRVADDECSSDEIELPSLHEGSETGDSFVLDGSAERQLEQRDAVGPVVSSPIENSVPSHRSSAGSDSEEVHDWEVISMDGDNRDISTHSTLTEEGMIQEKDRDQDIGRIRDDNEKSSSVEDEKTCDDTSDLEGFSPEMFTQIHSNVSDTDIDNPAEQIIPKSWTGNNHDVLTSSTVELTVSNTEHGVQLDDESLGDSIPMPSCTEAGVSTDSDAGQQFAANDIISISSVLEVEAHCTKNDALVVDEQSTRYEVECAARASNCQVDDDQLATVDGEVTSNDVTDAICMSQSSSSAHSTFTHLVEEISQFGADEGKRDTEAESNNEACPKDTSIGHVFQQECDDELSPAPVTIEPDDLSTPVPPEDVQPMTSCKQEFPTQSVADSGLSHNEVKSLESSCQTSHDDADIEGNLIDAECQTMPIEPFDSSPDTSCSLTPTERSGDELIKGKCDQDDSTQSMPEPDQPDQSNIREVDTTDHEASARPTSNSSRMGGHNDSGLNSYNRESSILTAKKFEVLLNEICEVDDVGSSDENYDVDIADSVRDDTINADRMPRLHHDVEYTKQASNGLVVESNKCAVKLQGERITSNHDNLHRSQVYVKDTERWNWPDEASLRMEIDERLRQSQHEYEEAISLSQSVGSFKSWASSAHMHPSRSITLSPEQEVLALQLSTSGFARKTTKAARASCEDTETERIARIMQGSLRRWLDDDDGDDYATSADEGDRYYF